MWGEIKTQMQIACRAGISGPARWLTRDRGKRKRDSRNITSSRQQSMLYRCRGEREISDTSGSETLVGPVALSHIQELVSGIFNRVLGQVP
jgi:hypothetical protein